MLPPYNHLESAFLKPLAVENLVSALRGLENDGTGDYVCGEIPACCAQ